MRPFTAGGERNRMNCSDIPDFRTRIEESGLDLSRKEIEILQINNGKLCNLACLHCHVEAGPKRTELMDQRTSERVIELLKNSPSVHTLDITGGAPEMNPHFRWMVQAARKDKRTVIDRCNLTIFFEAGYEELPEFLAKHEVYIIASLPCYTSENVDTQRGRGTFRRSIAGLRALNEMGYGKGNSRLRLDLVYNPLGASLPPEQEKLESDYKQRLQQDFGVSFDSLFTITNMPIRRFERQLENWGKRDEYMKLLSDSFNPSAAAQVMCRNLVSVDWKGNLFDCDFNQMLELPLEGEKTIWDIDNLNELMGDKITFADHCYGCTAGCGSSCGGALVP